MRAAKPYATLMSNLCYVLRYQSNHWDANHEAAYTAIRSRIYGVFAVYLMLGPNGETVAFDPPMNNIPLWNLREEFYCVREMLHSEHFVAALRNHERPIKTPILDWHGSDADLLSLLVQRAVQGVESYTVGAVWIKLSELGRMTTEMNKKVRNPFLIKGKSGTASAYYQHLPALIHPSLSIDAVDPEFWGQLTHFYKNVRNPLFHGSHFASGDVQNAIQSFWFVEELYAWLDQWHKPEWEPGQRMTLVFKTDA